MSSNNNSEESSLESIFDRLKQSFEASVEDEDKDFSFSTALQELISAFVSEQNGEGSIVSKWLLVAEVVDSEDRFMVSLNADNMAPWDYIGMLRTELTSVEFNYANAQMAATYLQHMDEEDDD